MAFPSITNSNGIWSLREHIENIVGSNWPVNPVYPLLTITDNKTTMYAGESVTFTFTWSVSVTGFTADDITVTGGTKGTFSGSGTTYTLVVTDTTGGGTIITSVPANCCTGSGAQNPDSYTYTQTVTQSIPVITDNQSGDIAAGSNVTFTFTWPVSMSNFTADDVTVTGGTKGTFSGSGTSYTLVVTDTTNGGTIYVSVPANVCTTTTGGYNNGASSTHTQTVRVPFTVEFLVVGAGGGGGSHYNWPYAGGGGGGGDVQYQSANIVSPTISVTVGGGGAKGYLSTRATAGGSSSVSCTGVSLTNNHGGGGGQGATITINRTPLSITGSTGGSGGAGGGPTDNVSGGSGSGYYGGSVYANNYAGAGGAGSDSNGESITGSGVLTGGNGGSGATSSISGTSTTYGGGGGGGAYSTGTIGTATHGGGNGGKYNVAYAENGATNRGGGGGGGGVATSDPYNEGGNGGSGIVIIAYSNTYPNLTTLSGLTYTLDTTTRSGYKVYKITGGTGTITV